MGRRRARGQRDDSGSCGGKVHQGPRLWTGEPANWNSIAGASAEDLDRIQRRFYSILVPSQGHVPCFSLHMAISHTLAFCPRRVAHLCPPRGPWGPQKAEGFRRGLEKSQAPPPLSPLWYFFTPLTLDLTPPLSSLLTHTDTHTPSYPKTFKIYC